MSSRPQPSAAGHRNPSRGQAVGHVNQRLLQAPIPSPAGLAGIPGSSRSAREFRNGRALFHRPNYGSGTRDSYRAKVHTEAGRRFCHLAAPGRELAKRPAQASTAHRTKPLAPVPTPSAGQSTSKHGSMPCFVPLPKEIPLAAGFLFSSALFLEPDQVPSASGNQPAPVEWLCLESSRHLSSRSLIFFSTPWSVGS